MLRRRLHLREAVIAANEHRGADVISLPTGRYELEIPSTGEDAAADGDLDITSGPPIRSTPVATVAGSPPETSATRP